MRSAWVVQSVLGLTRLLLLIQGTFIAVIAWGSLVDLGPGGPPQTENETDALIASVIALAGFAIGTVITRD
jgi:hypothetical protein